MILFKSEEEKAQDIRRRILRAATALYNACEKSYKENQCKGCPFDVPYGCNLYGHPVDWEEKLKSIKKAGV
jgi:hypothetical protein